MTYKITITIIPKTGTNLIELSNKIRDNIDSLLTVPEKKSYMIYIIIFILLLLGGLGWFYFKRQ